LYIIYLSVLYALVTTPLKDLLAMMCSWEECLLDDMIPSPESLEVLASFCHTGERPSMKLQDPWVKELLGYRLLDVMAQFHGIGIEEGNKDKSLTPLTSKLVSCLVIPPYHIHCIFTSESEILG
jgi:hypothetical protein